MTLEGRQNLLICVLTEKKRDSLVESGRDWLVYSLGEHPDALMRG
jgi:hypothetical protein